MKKTIIMISVILLMAGASFAQEAQETQEETKTNDSKEIPNYWEEMQKFYGVSREMGEKSAQWVKDDIQKIGDWEYLIVTLEAKTDEELTIQLNTLGKARWEAIWIQEKMQGVRFYLKRPIRTYMKHIPIGDLLKMMPKGEAE